ncbi:hypothetical protein IF1G_07853 [Cordyceps javanica]|uniref:Uncharacterized protein n=1 Tax=Cordyceps javanica TaxID=43265 RepID=A0A545UUZ2_9HYPO|nr:hypothetical protein IF1G_07853 [Cordyceps javanica]
MNCSCPCLGTASDKVLSTGRIISNDCKENKDRTGSHGSCRRVSAPGSQEVRLGARTRLIRLRQITHGPFSILISRLPVMDTCRQAGIHRQDKEKKKEKCNSYIGGGWRGSAHLGHRTCPHTKSSWLGAQSCTAQEADRRIACLPARLPAYGVTCRL